MAKKPAEPGDSFYQKITADDRNGFIEDRLTKLEGAHYALTCNLVEHEVDLDLAAEGPERDAVVAEITSVSKQIESLEGKIERLRQIIES